MKVLVWYPDWNNRWIPYFKKELSCYDTTFTSETEIEKLRELSKDKDLFISMWAEGIVNLWATEFSDKPIICYLRRYEAFYPQLLGSIMWGKIDALIFVNRHIMSIFKEYKVPQPKSMYYHLNGVDLDEWKFSKVKNGKPTKIAFACKTTYIKNVPFAMQVLSLLPKEYTIHHIGRVDKRYMLEFAFYGSNLGIIDRWFWHGSVSPDQIQEWYADKDFIMSTSVNEGNPNNVIEGMAVGLKPVVHNWPGAKDQFPEACIFNTAEEAAWIIQEGGYYPESYRKWVEDYYSLDNIKQIHRVIEDVLRK